MSVEPAAMILVVKNKDPSFPSLMPNLSWKKKVSQELDRSVKIPEAGTLTYSGARPDANASRANKMHKLTTIIRLSALITGSNDRA